MVPANVGDAYADYVIGYLRARARWAAAEERDTRWVAAAARKDENDAHLAIDPGFRSQRRATRVWPQCYPSIKPKDFPERVRAGMQRAAQRHQAFLDERREFYARQIPASVFASPCPGHGAYHCCICYR